MFPLSGEIAVGLLSVKCVLYISVLNKDVAEQWAMIIANKTKFFGGFTFSFNRHNCSALCQGGAFYASGPGFGIFFAGHQQLSTLKIVLVYRSHFIDHTLKLMPCFIVQPGEFWQSPTPPLYFNWHDGTELPPAAMCSCDSSQMEDTVQERERAVFGWKKASI